MTILLADPRVQAIPVRDNGAPLVPRSFARVLTLINEDGVALRMGALLAGVPA